MEYQSINRKIIDQHLGTAWNSFLPKYKLIIEMYYQQRQYRSVLIGVGKIYFYINGSVFVNAIGNFGDVVGSVARNTYTTLLTTNPLFMDFFSYSNILK